MTIMPLKSKILSYDRAVPRYTSYPAATIFQSNFPPETYAEWLAALEKGAHLSLYVHIPFCPKLCHYCGCFTHITERYAPVEDYVHFLRREIIAMGRRLDHQQVVTHLHFGGGSPTMLREEDFQILMEAFRSSFTFASDAEIAVEVDPRHITPPLAETYAKMGVNRISLGVQDFDQKVMETVNRIQPFDVVYKAAEVLRRAGIHSINLDFIYGLPYQTLRSLTRSMDYALLLKPDRVALYGYAHVPWKKKNMRLIPEDALPDNALRYDLFMEGARILEEFGFRAIGIDHFARPEDGMARAQGEGHLGRNFQGYTNIAPDALIGFGVSAISQLPQGYAQNTTSSHDYQEAILQERGLPVAKGYVFQGDDKARKEIIDGLMCNLSVNVRHIWIDHALPLPELDRICDSLTPFLRDELASLSAEGLLTIRPEARPLVRIIAASFDEYLPPLETTHRHSMAV